ncbi:MAG TPA: YigZ family protein [Candidatus Ventrimonas merdavium]|nr:YigZ family protein [Candidatus Ventrimonas merdavium]
MTEGYKILYRGGQGELVEKKSRFIATTRPVESEEEALAFVAEMKKTYWDARHNCWAYVIGDKGQLQRCSDDGEPSQTAGRPMLDVLLGEGVRNACVVVTRYFGGVLLGTGGLVRAYSGAVQAGLQGSVIVEKQPAKKFSIATDYNGMGKIQYAAGQLGITILDTVYTDQVDLTVLVPLELEGSFLSQVTERTGGRAQISPQGEVFFGTADGELIVFEENCKTA